jgi:hypothetical protein
VALERKEFSQWGLNYGLGLNWTLSQLDSLSYASFLNETLRRFPLLSEMQINEFVTYAGNEVWENQDKLFDHLSGEHLPHCQWKPKKIESVLEMDLHKDLKDYGLKLSSQTDLLDWDSLFMRNAISDTPFTKMLHKKLTPLVEKHLGIKVAPSYSFFSFYGDQGYCPPHRDRSECQWTLDLCVAQDKVWPIFIENEQIDLKENDAVIYSGTDQVHWRQKIHESGFCHLIFFHFKER